MSFLMQFSGVTPFVLWQKLWSLVAKSFIHFRTLINQQLSGKWLISYSFYAILEPQFQLLHYPISSSWVTMWLSDFSPGWVLCSTSSGWAMTSAAVFPGSSRWRPSPAPSSSPMRTMRRWHHWSDGNAARQGPWRFWRWWWGGDGGKMG